MESGASSHQGYLITEESDDDSEFSFITDHEIKYIVYFKEADGYVPSASFAQELKMFGFGPVTATRSPGKLPKDNAVMITLFEVLFYYIAKYPNRILVYVCSNESSWKPGPDDKHPRYAKWRSDTFSGWFQKWQQTGAIPAEKIDYDLYGVLHCSCLFKIGNPFEKEIRQVIDQTILEKQP